MKKQYIIIALVLMVLSALLAYSVGQNSAKEKLEAEKEYLQTLNRVDLERFSQLEDPIYVIGHKSPDSDTVITAITFARLLNTLGIEAIPAVTDKVNNETAYILAETGTECPEILYDVSGLNIFMVDHSEYVQAAEGMVDANIVGILDHHGVGTVNVGQQVLYNAKPIGSTATIVWLDYLNYGVEIDKQTAHLLLGAVLSDTDNLSVSSSTSADAEAIKYLAKIAEVDDPDAFYTEMHEKKLSYEGFSNLEIIFSDYKEYESSGVKYGVGLAQAIDEEGAKALAVQVAGSMQDAIKSVDVDLFYLSIRAENVKYDYIVPADERSESTLKAAFPNYDEYDGTSYVYKGGLGRKSKFVPGLNDFLAEHPHE